MEATQTKEIGNYRIEIYPEDSPSNPREWDNLGTMICFHRRYSLGDKHNYDFNDYSGWDDQEKAISKQEDACVILPLYLYDHSGITISTTPFSCRWDSGQIGWVVVSKEKVRKEYSVTRITKKIIEKVNKVLVGEVGTYDQYLTGDVYGYRVFLDDEEIDSCWGFYGEDECMGEAEGIVKYYIEKAEKLALA